MLLFIGTTGVGLVGWRPVAEGLKGSIGGVGNPDGESYSWPYGVSLGRSTLLPLSSYGDGRGTDPTGCCVL